LKRTKYQTLSDFFLIFDNDQRDAHLLYFTIYLFEECNKYIVKIKQVCITLVIV